jgi:hypothetical protein
MSRGQLAILGMVGIALGAAGFGLWWRHVQTRQALEFWGPAAAGQIATADEVEAMLVEPWAGPDEESTGRYQGLLRVGSQKYGILAAKDVTRAPGFLNARHALTLDNSFDWQADPIRCQPTWRHAIRFSSPASQVTILLDFRCERVRRSDAERTAGIGPIAAGLQAVLNEQLSISSDGEDDFSRGDSAKDYSARDDSARKE